MVTPAAPQPSEGLFSDLGWTAKRHQRDPPRISTEEERLAGGARPWPDHREIAADNFKGVTDRAAAQDTLAHPLQRAGNLRQHVLDAGSKQEEAGVPTKLSRGNREPAVSFPGNRSHLRLDRRLTERRELFAHPLKQRRPADAVRKGWMVVRARDQGRAAAPVVKDDRAAAEPGEEDSRSETSRPAAEDTTIAIGVASICQCYHALQSHCASNILSGLSYSSTAMVAPSSPSLRERIRPRSPFLSGDDPIPSPGQGGSVRRFSRSSSLAGLAPTGDRFLWPPSPAAT